MAGNDKGFKFLDSSGFTDNGTYTPAPVPTAPPVATAATPQQMLDTQGLATGSTAPASKIATTSGYGTMDYSTNSNGTYVPTAPPGATASGASATPGSLGLTYTGNPYDTQIDTAQKAATADYNAGTPDFNAIKDQTTKGFQAQLDALDREAADARARVTQQYQQLGQARLGQQRALQAGSGMLGQVSGASEQIGLQTRNAEEQNAAVEAKNAEYASKRETLMGNVSKIATDQYNARLAAYTKGADATVQYLKDKQTKSKENAAQAAKLAATSGIDLSSPEHAQDAATLAKQLGVSTQDLISSYVTEAQAYKKVQAEEAAAAAKLEKDGQITLSQGQVLYDRNGKVIARGEDKPMIIPEGATVLNPDGTVAFKAPKTVAPGTDTGLGGDIPVDTVAATNFLKGRTPSQVQAFGMVPDNLKASIMQLVNGDALLADVVKSRGIQGNAQINALISAATAIDPKFSVNANKQRNKFQEQWNNPQSKAYITRDAINTGLGHLAELKQVLNGLSSSNFSKYNTLQQWLSKESNGQNAASVSEFNQIVNLLAPEIAKVYQGGVPDVKSVAEQRDALLAINPSQINSRLVDLTANLLTSKLNSTAQEYKNVIGSFPDEPLVHTEVLDKLQASGVNTQEMTKALIQQGMRASSVHDYVAAFPDKANAAITIKKQNPALSDEDILQILQPDFSEPGSGGQNAQPYTPSPISTIQLGSPLAQKNNNPGNLRFANQPGAIPGAGGFARFPSPEAGVEALRRQIALDTSRGHTVGTFINKYAPPSENDTGLYVSQAEKALGLSRNTPLSKVDQDRLLRFIALKESSTKLG